MRENGMKKLFNEMMKDAERFHETKRKFDQAIIEKYGFHYSDKDIDEIIDSIDYGQGGLDYKDFTELMNKAKNKNTTN